MCLADLIDFNVARLPAALPKTWRDIHPLSAVPSDPSDRALAAGDGTAEPSTTTTQGTAP